ncbi:hypothetical protein BH09VER1_BH09VER1_44230 [soil metagenome]
MAETAKNSPDESEKMQLGKFVPFPAELDWRSAALVEGGEVDLDRPLVVEG